MSSGWINVLYLITGFALGCAFLNAIEVFRILKKRRAATQGDKQHG